MRLSSPPDRPWVQASPRSRRIEGPTSLRRSPTLAAVLSFIVPGLGQVVSGRPRRGLIFLAPIVFLVLVILEMLASDRPRLIGFLVRPEVLIGLFVINLLLLVWRGAAIVDAWRGVPGRRVRRSTTGSVVLVVLVLATLSTHAVVGGFTYLAYDAEAAIFGGSGGGFGTLDGSPGSSSSPGSRETFGSGGVVVPTPRPVPQPLADGRLDILLLGGDSGPGRWSLRTDTLIVLSVDVKTGRAAMFGIPRNLVNTPLGPESKGAFACGCFPDLINALYVYASGHAKYFPGTDDTRGLLAIQSAIGELTGLQLDGLVLVNLNGFVRLVDAVGGIDIKVPYAVRDSRYPTPDGKGYKVLNITKGQHHFSGLQALEYARSRHQDSDYGRMQRQQITLTALAKQVTSESLFAKVPELLGIAKTNLWTNLSVDNLSEFIELALRADVNDMARITFIPPKYPSHVTSSSLTAIRKVVADVFLQPVKPAATPTPAATSPSPTP
jgi:LCP family protein required for cell wall assembly